MTTLRRQTVFAGLDQPEAWPATRGRPQPQRLDAELDVLPGVGATLKRRLAKLGMRTVRDLLEHRPRRYESAVEQVAIGSLAGTEEVAIAGEVVSVS
jgi:ATP-dependent DNA helicase RecG